MIITVITSHVNTNLVVLGRLAARSVLLSEKGLGRNHILHNISYNIFLLQMGRGAMKIVQNNLERPSTKQDWQ